MISVKKLIYKIVNRLYYVPTYGAITGGIFEDKQLNSVTGTWQNIGTITLPAGVWLVYLMASFAQNTSGVRQLTIGDTSTSAGVVIRTARVAPANGAATTVQLNCPLQGGNTYYVNGAQNSGSKLTVQTRYTAVKIGEDTSSVS